MIFFDIDGTLINHAAASEEASLSFYDHFAGAIPFPRDRFPEIWEGIVNKHFNRYCTGEISIWEQRRARIRETFADSGLPDAECDARYQIYIREYESLTRPYGDAAACLERLRGRPLGIISNGARDQQVGKLQRAGLLKHFSVLVFSEDVGLGKPSPRIFFEACRRAGAEPSSCTHVGDDLIADVAASHALGIRAVWLDRSGREPNPVAARRITSLLEFGPELFTTKDTKVHEGDSDRLRVPS